MNIAMLRLWLSLAIEYDDDDNPPPLPNLDFKVLCGDSLLGPDPSAGTEVQGELGRDAGRIARLGQLKAEYMRASVGKDKLREQIDGLRQEIRAGLGNAGAAADGPMDWRVEFAEVLNSGRGFDIAIANPPYVQLQKDGGRLANLYRDAGYETFARTGDLYQLFYERGCQVLTPGRGLLTYITSNSWLKAEYGKSTRRYFAEKHTPLRLLELGKDVFETAIVDSGVMVARLGKSGETGRAVDLDRLADKTIPPAEHLWGELRVDGEKPWSVLSAVERSAMDKMETVGTPLKGWDVRINDGIKTGYDKAFVIDTTTRDDLVTKDSKSADVLHPILRGRDIQRFRSIWAGLWLVNVPWHFPLHLDSSVKGSSSEAEKLFSEQYPAVYRHLLAHKDRLAARAKSETGIRYEWYALQRARVTYREKFAEEKLLWIELADNGRFAYSDSEEYFNDKGFMMTGTSIKYLCALMNAQLIRWYMRQVAPTSGMGTLLWKKVYVETIPIPKISEAEQRPMVRLVEEILAAKDANPQADTEDLEREIDRLVYELYGLTEEEETAIERSLGLIHVTDEEEDAALARLMEEQEPYGPEDFVSEEEVRRTLRAVSGS